MKTKALRQYYISSPKAHFIPDPDFLKIEFSSEQSPPPAHILFFSCPLPHKTSSASPSCQYPGFVLVSAGFLLCLLTYQLAPGNPKTRSLPQLRWTASSALRGPAASAGFPGFAYRYLHPPSAQVHREQGRTHLCVSTDALDLQGWESGPAGGRLNGQY